MKALFVHAHFDDYEFTAGGTFELLRRRLGGAFRPKVIVCTDGKAGHHARTREETGRIRIAEQDASAKLGGYEWELLRLPNGEVPREACLQVTPDLLAALWKAIRDFEPDYLFCPPLPGEPLAGVHNDHWTIAEAVRRVAYMVNVPHAFTPEFPADETRSEQRKTPVIVHVYDAYMSGANSFDLAVDVEEVFPLLCQMAWAHQSQVVEWLPWVGRHKMDVPKSTADWEKILRARFARKNSELGLATKHAMEVFTVSAWGEVPACDELLAELPVVSQESSNLERLKSRLGAWRA